MDKFNQLKLSAKFLVLIAISLSGLIALAAVAFDTVGTVKVGGPLYQSIIDDEDLLTDVVPPALHVLESYVTALQLAHADDKAEIHGRIQRWQAQRHEYDKRQAAWAKRLSHSDKKDLLEQPHRSALAFFDVVDRQLIPAKLAGDAHAVAEIVGGPLDRAYAEHDRVMDGAAARAHDAHVESERSAAALVRERTVELLMVAAGIAVLLIWLAYIITRSVTRRIAIGVQAAEKIASGDLTSSIVVDAQDEAGTLLGALKKMTGSLSSLILRVKQSSVSLMSTATQISVTSKEQEATVNNLSASTAEIAAAVKEISATSQELRGTLQEINTAATRSSSLAEHGRTGLSEMDATMRQLSDSTASISSKLSVIREKASDINGVVTTITKVADQTNLLSVNAAIEAEKAGEYGLGFLVVAREIRRLADQSAVATLDIEQMVRQMQTAVSAGVMEMDKFAEEVRRSARTVSDINGQLGQIIEEVQSLSHRIESVSEGMSSQAQGAAQISEAMSQLTESARQTASSIKEFNTATSTLREAVTGLKEEIASFTVAS